MKKPILITGSHRSGSTWVGKIIGLSPDILYVQEPFNISTHPDAPMCHWFEYVSDAYPEIGQLEIKRYLERYKKFNFRRLSKRISEANYLYKVKEAIIYEYGTLTNRPLYKDPIALLSAEWFYKEFDADVVVLIRHPAAFTASIMVKDWNFDFKNFLNQPQVLQDYFSKYEEVMKKQLEKDDIIATGILIWTMLYDYVLQLQKKYNNHPKWTFVKHEELSLNPVKTFKNIFKKHKIEFTDKILKEVELSTSSKKKLLLRRDSKKNITSWKSRLSIDEIKLIKEGTLPIWTQFYTESDW